MDKNIYLASKPRYEILDGLRGVAAIMVILFHCLETYIPIFGVHHINHGYLAVDFFFLLSGFVIGYAYDDRWDRMTTWGYFKRRLVRLHPMVVAGTVIGACLFFYQDGAFPQIAQCEGWMFGLCFVMGLLMIPCGHGLDIRGWAEFNSFNGPNWSLTFEYFGNILYALVLRRLPTIILAVLAVCSIFFTLDLTMGWDVFGLFPLEQVVGSDGTVTTAGGPQYNVIGGWSIDSQQLYIGFTRLLYPFLCGLVISRILPKRISGDNPSGSPIHLKGGFWWCALALIIIFSVPKICGRPGVADGLYQVVSIVLLFPLIVLAGAGSVTSGRTSTKVCQFLGAISYPVYMVHYPLMYMQMAWVGTHPEAPVWQHIVLNIGVVFLSISIAWALLKLYDEPVREWLKEKFLYKKG